MPVNNDAPSLGGGGGGGCKERKITREGWGNAENPGFDGDDETTTCLATVKSSSSRRGTVRGARVCVCNSGLSTDVFPSTNRATFSTVEFVPPFFLPPPPLLIFPRAGTK